MSTSFLYSCLPVAEEELHVLWKEILTQAPPTAETRDTNMSFMDGIAVANLKTTTWASVEKKPHYQWNGTRSLSATDDEEFSRETTFPTKPHVRRSGVTASGRGVFG